MKIDLSLKNEKLYASCSVTEVGGRLNLETPVEIAVSIVGRNIETMMDTTDDTNRDEVTLTGAMSLWSYLIVFHAVLHRFDRVYYDDGRSGRVLVAQHGPSVSLETDTENRSLVDKVGDLEHVSAMHDSIMGAHTRELSALMFAQGQLADKLRTLQGEPTLSQHIGPWGPDYHTVYLDGQYITVSSSTGESVATFNTEGMALAHRRKMQGEADRNKMEQSAAMRVYDARKFAK